MITTTTTTDVRARAYRAAVLAHARLNDPAWANLLGKPERARLGYGLRHLRHALAGDEDLDVRVVAWCERDLALEASTPLDADFWQQRFRMEVAA